MRCKVFIDFQKKTLQKGIQNGSAQPQQPVRAEHPQDLERHQDGCQVRDCLGYFGCSVDASIDTSIDEPVLFHIHLPEVSLSSHYWITD